MTAPVLIDTNALLALNWTGDIHPAHARQFMRNIRSGRVVAAPVLPELFFMVNARANYANAMRVFAQLQSSAFQIEPLTPADMARMTEIMAEYADNQFDFVDVAIMALSERLNIDSVFTFDRRDFTVFRPRHRPFLVLLP